MDFRLICLLLGYSIGCIQVAYMVCRRMGGIDIREHGSGNPGTTNVVRVMGLKLGVVVFIMDLAKGAAAFALCTIIFGGAGEYPLSGLYGALGAVLGHDFPIQLKGRGGKGSATTVGLILLLDWRIALICYLTGVINLVLTKYMSLSSMLVAIMMTVLLYVFGYPPESVGVGAVIAALSLFQHRTNISRLLTGKENKFNFKKQG